MVAIRPKCVVERARVDGGDGEDRDSCQSSHLPSSSVRGQQCNGADSLKWGTGRDGDGEQSNNLELRIRGIRGNLCLMAAGDRWSKYRNSGFNRSCDQNKT